MNLDPRGEGIRELTLFDLGKRNYHLVEYKFQFQYGWFDFAAAFTALALPVVFIALLLISFVISRLRLFERKIDEKQPIQLPTPLGIVVAKETVDELGADAIIAVITAIHKHKAETAMENKVLLTWRRGDISMWQSSGKLELPNKQFNLIKKR
jgi:hypothetical protein